MNTTYLKYSIILGILTAFGPICTDFYLPALPQISSDLHTAVPLSQLSLTAALIGLGIGQPIGLVEKIVDVGIGTVCLKFDWLYFRTGHHANGSDALYSRFCRCRRCCTCPSDCQRLLCRQTVGTVFCPDYCACLGGIQLRFTESQGLFASLSILGVVIFLLCYFLISESHDPNCVRQLQKSFKIALSTAIKDKIFIGLCL